MPQRDTFLTERQLQVLRLRKERHSQTEIAKKLGTSRANISATEKMALNNIKRAKNTIELVKLIEAPIWLTVEPNSDLNDVVKDLYQLADSEGIRVTHTFTSLAKTIQEKASGRIRGRKILEKLDVAVARDGAVIIK